MDFDKYSYCKKEFIKTSNSKGFYCSRSCAATINNAIHKKKIRTSQFCKTCKKELKNQQEFYCSNKCQMKYRKDITIDQWIKGIFNGSTGDGSLSSTIRNYLLEKYDNKCSRPECRWGIPNPYTKKVILTIDHKDGDIYNGFVSNIELICWNCHTLTSTFGNLNKGNGKRNTVGMRQYNHLRFQGESNSR